MLTRTNFSFDKALADIFKKRKKEKNYYLYFNNILGFLFAPVADIESVTVTSKYVDLFSKKLFQCVEGFY